MHQIFWGSNATPLVVATVRSGIGDSGMASIDRRTTSSFRQVFKHSPKVPADRLALASETLAALIPVDPCTSKALENVHFPLK